jgi:hypothetical protein
MLQLLHDMPPFVVAVRATGKVTKDDFDKVLLPAFDRVARAYDGIHFLLVLDNDISDFTLGAWWDDMKAGIQHFTKWKKIAVVTDSPVVEKFSDFFTLLTPGKSKGYKKHELVQAKTWIAEL